MAGTMLLVLAGCGGTAVNSPFVNPAYTRSLVNSAIVNGALPVAVHGGATASLDQAATQQVIVTQVRPPSWMTNGRFAPAGADAQRRVVFIMNPDQIGRAANRACGPLDEMATGTGGERIIIVGAFCDDADVITSNNGSVPTGDDAATALATLAQQMTLALLPFENPVHRRGRRVDGGP